MAIKFYSDKTKQYYASMEEANKAEMKLHEAENLAKIKADREKAEKEKLATERKARAAEVEAARKKMVDAQKAYKDALTAFVKDYGSYHLSTTTTEDIPTLFDFFNWF